VAGVGGAMMVPVGRLVVLRTTAKSELVRAIAYLTWPAPVAPVVAPAPGGILSTYASWRWIFVIDVPLGIGAVLLARRLVPDVRGSGPTALDRRGFLLTALGVGALVVGMESLGAPDPQWVIVGVGLGVAVVALVLAVRHLLHAERPLLDLRVLRAADAPVRYPDGAAGSGRGVGGVPWSVSLSCSPRRRCRCSWACWC